MVVNDPFLSDPSKKKRKRKVVDEEINSDEFDSDNENVKRHRVESEEEDETAPESKTERRRRLAKLYLESLKQEMGPVSLEGVEAVDLEIADLENFEFDAEDVDRENISRRLQQDVAGNKGVIYKFISDKLNFLRKKVVGTKIGAYMVNPTGISVQYPSLYVVSKGLQLIKYDISGAGFVPKRTKYVNMKGEEYHTDEITCVAVSSDGKFVVTGGKDKHILIWDTAKLSLLKKIPLNHRNAVVNSISFRHGSHELYVASSDLKIRIYNVNQFALIDTLYGHQDEIVGISALSQERCVTVGSRDRTAMYWKIPEQTRLTFNSGTSFEKFYNTQVKEAAAQNIELPDKQELQAGFVKEGSLECVSMIDNIHFVTGSDNGNISFWSIQRKKPIYIKYQAHGLQDKLTPEQYSGDKDYISRGGEVPRPQPYWITAVYAIPYSDIFITGSWNGVIKVWQVDKTLKNFTLKYNLHGAKGIITKIDAAEIQLSKKAPISIAIFATVSKEHRLGRWIQKPYGASNQIYQAVIKVK